MNTKDIEEIVGKVANALHAYAGWLLNNPDAEPLKRRSVKNIMANDIVNTLTTKHQAELEKAVEAERERIYKSFEDCPSFDDALNERALNE